MLLCHPCAQIPRALGCRERQRAGMGLKCKQRANLPGRAKHWLSQHRESTCVPSRVCHRALPAAASPYQAAPSHCLASSRSFHSSSVQNSTPSHCTASSPPAWMESVPDSLRATCCSLAMDKKGEVTVFTFGVKLLPVKTNDLLFFFCTNRKVGLARHFFEKNL